MKKYTFYNSLILSILLFGFIAGCVHQKPMINAHKMHKLKGIYHKVKPGETLWGIAKIYNVELKKIVEINRIPDVTKIETGQLIFIPKFTKKISASFNETQTSFINNKKFIWPIQGEIISYYGSIYKNRINKGIDIKTVSYKTNILASRSGKIVLSDNLRGYGKTIIIDHSDGFFSVYSNIQDFLVKLNDSVSQGQVIAKLKKTSNPNSGIHFEIRKNCKPKNPLFYLP